MMLPKILSFLILLHLTNGAVYLESPPFSKGRTAFGMSRARSPTYDYEFDPEVVKGYTRQDSHENGTAVSASGKYFITSEASFYIRVDARNCKRYPEHGPKICFCYKTVNRDIKDPECDKMPGFAHICQNTKNINNANAANAKITGSYFNNKNQTKSLGNFLSYHIHFIFSEIFEAAGVVIFGTNNLAGGLHLANGEYYKEYTDTKNENFVLKRTTSELYNVYTGKYHVLGKPNVTALGTELYFPKNLGCVRIDFNGLMYAGKLLQEKKEDTIMPIYKVAYNPKPNTDNNIQPEGTRLPRPNEATRPNPISKDICDYKCCEMASKPT